MDGVEEVLVHLVEDLELLGGIEGLGVLDPGLAQGGRHAFELDVIGQLGDPGVERIFQRVAVRAAIPEHFGHVDLAIVAAQLDLIGGDGVVLALGDRGGDRHGRQAKASEAHHQ